MKILIPVICFGKSGGYRVLSKIANELITLGYQVEFLCPDGSEEPYFPTLAAVNWVNGKGEWHQKRINNSVKKENFFSIQKKLFMALKKKPTDSYDIIFANHSLTVLPVLLRKLSNKTLYYIQAYEPEYYLQKGGLKSMLLQFLSRLTYKKNIYKVVNAAIYKKYREINTPNVLYPGIDFSIFYSDNTSKKTINTSRIIIGTVGRLEKYKGTIYVLDAFKIIRQKHPGAELHVAYGNQSDYNNIEGVVCIHPANDIALGEFYRSLHYYFCAGYVQLGAFHYPLVEAMCCGISAITTAYYPADNNNSWITAPKDVQDIVNKFEEAHANPIQQQEKIQAAIISTQQFQWKKTGEILSGYLLELQTNNKGNRTAK